MTTNSTQTIDGPTAVLNYAATQLNRQQKRHAKQAVEHADAVKEQGVRLVKCRISHSKHKPHVGKKQLMKLQARQGGEA